MKLLLTFLNTPSLPLSILDVANVWIVGMCSKTADVAEL